MKSRVRTQKMSTPTARTGPRPSPPQRSRPSPPPPPRPSPGIAPSEHLLNLFNERSRFNFPTPNPVLPTVPSSRYTFPYNVETGRGIYRTRRALPATPGSMTLKLQTLPIDLQMNILWNLIDTFLPFMKLDPQLANVYRVPLTVKDVERLAKSQNREEKHTIYDKYITNRRVPHPDIYKLYKFPPKTYFLTEWNPNQTALEKLIDRVKRNVNNFILGSGVSLDQTQIDNLNRNLDELKNPDSFYEFLNAPIPHFSYLTIINPSQINWNFGAVKSPEPSFRRLPGFPGLQSKPGLTILETREWPKLTIDKPTITLLDILISTMSVKSLKEDFLSERLTGIDYYPEQNTLSLQIGNQ